MPYEIARTIGGALECAKLRGGLSADDNVIWSARLLTSSSRMESWDADPNDPNSRASNFEAPATPGGVGEPQRRRRFGENEGIV